MGSLSEAMALSRGGNARMDSKGIAQGGGSGVSNTGAVQFNLDTRGFNAAMLRVVKETRRSAEDTVKYGMILMLTAGRAATPKGKARRKIIKGTQGFWDHFDVWYQGQPKPIPMMLPVVRRVGGMSVEQQQKNYMMRQSIIQRYTNIERVGFAKSSWGWALKKFCNTGSQRLPGRVDHDPITGIKAPLLIRVENKLDWINKLVPSIEGRMVTAATKKMLYRLDNNLKGAFARSRGV